MYSSPRKQFHILTISEELIDEFKTLKGRGFPDDNEVLDAVENWFYNQHRSFFIHHLVDHWDTCFNLQVELV
ncbi:hypothetical protein TNCV_2463461 [Trichonephila clavipes]|nr:hypothetical protein TNCV_2463461 [Trichonephila clavipes]